MSMADVDVGAEAADAPMGSSSVTGGSSLPDSSDDQLGSESEDDFGSVEDFPADEQETADTTARQHFEEGKDQQGIPWERLQVRTLHPCESSANRSATCMGWHAPARCHTRSPRHAVDPATTHPAPRRASTTPTHRRRCLVRSTGSSASSDTATT